jgi:hypothetical protein
VGIDIIVVAIVEWPSVRAAKEARSEILHVERTDTKGRKIGEKMDKKTSAPMGSQESVVPPGQRPEPAKAGAGIYDELAAAWDLATEDERKRFCEYAQLADSLLLAT